MHQAFQTNLFSFFVIFWGFYLAEMAKAPRVSKPKHYLVVHWKGGGVWRHRILVSNAKKETP